MEMRGRPRLVANCVKMVLDILSTAQYGRGGRIFDEDIVSAHRVVCGRNMSVDDCIIDDAANSLFIDAFERHALETVDRGISDTTIPLEEKRAFIDLRRGFFALKTPEFSDERDKMIAILNFQLLNLRKGGKLRSTHMRGYVKRIRDDACQLAAEMAARITQDHHHGVNVDEMICDPRLREEFDGLADHFYPGLPSLEYRKCLLSLRKSSRFKPEHVKKALKTPIFMMETADYFRSHAPEIPEMRGVYVISMGARTLYVGQSMNIRMRLNVHLSGNFMRDGELILTLFKVDSAPLRDALEHELIRTRHPELNIQL